jgi:hypothetical protein
MLAALPQKVGSRSIAALSCGCTSFAAQWSSTTSKRPRQRLSKDPTHHHANLQLTACLTNRPCAACCHPPAWHLCTQVLLYALGTVAVQADHGYPGAADLACRTRYVWCTVDMSAQWRGEHLPTLPLLSKLQGSCAGIVQLILC